MTDERASVRTEAADDAALLVALRHELRRTILRAMLAEGRPISPRRLSDDLHEPLSNVSYHVRVLLEQEAVELVDTQPVRGSMQHFYVPAVEAPWALAVLEAEVDRGQDDPPCGEIAA
jgi:DNA-binding transcriptional ArsR family regulator